MCGAHPTLIFTRMTRLEHIGVRCTPYQTEHHKKLPNILSIVASAGMVLCIYGVVRLDLWPTIFGIALAYIGKSWFLDRMVWLYEDMKDTHPEYRKWLY